MPSVLIAGGGLVGSVNACLFGQKGWKVTVFESRSDPRGKNIENGKSINLALGFRAMSALKRIGLKEKVIEVGVPVTRKIAHRGEQDGILEKLPVLNEGDFVLTINRHQLSQLLIDEAEKYSNVTFNFACKATRFNLTTKSICVETADSSFNADGDLILACDGAHSSIRRSLLKVPGFNFNQKYIDFGYMDLSVKIPKSCELQIGIHNSWRREGVILVALVNRDATLTVSMFAKFSVFDEFFSSPEGSALFLQNNFSIIYNILGETHILDTFTRNKPQAIISVQCSQHAFYDKLVLMGDAAHAMVPFNGQGVNCGFEDCLVFHEFMEQFGEDQMTQAVREYSRVRTNDTNAMNQMEWESYLQVERVLYNHHSGWIQSMRSFLNLPSSLIFPSSYLLATFSRETYSEIARKAQFVEGSVLLLMISLSFILIVAVLFVLIFWFS